MSADTLNGPLYLAFAVGSGLLVGGLGLAVRRWGRWGRVGVGGCGATVTVGAAAVLDPEIVPVAGGLAALPVGMLLLAGTRAWAALAAALRRPQVLGGLAAVAGVAVLVGGQAWYDRATQKAQNDDLAQLMLSEYFFGSRVDAVGVAAVTDQGNPVRLSVPAERRTPAEMIASEKAMMNNPAIGSQLIRRRPADDGYNCHGWVFTGGRFWVASESIDAILAENGYTAAPAPAAGDVVIYRNEDGKVTHTALVRAVADDGTVLTEGKWGALGVYLHEVAASSYGQRYTFYRSPRGGHLLRGLEPAPAP